MNSDELMAHNDKPIRLLEQDGKPWCIATLQYEMRYGKNNKTWTVLVPTADSYGRPLAAVGGLVWPLSAIDVEDIKLDDGELSLVLPRQTLSE